MDADRLGLIVEGSLVDGLRARLHGDQSVEDIRVGQFVRVTGHRHDYFCLVTDVRLDATNQDLLADPPLPSDAFARQVLAGTTAYGALAIQPMLMLARDSSDGEKTVDTDEVRPEPVRTIPPHFAEVFNAVKADFDRVFGAEAKHRFEIGQPLVGDDLPVRLNLQRFVERSNGVFGKSGTGKSFLTRLLLCGVIESEAAVNLVFDMHNEHGRGGRTEDGKTKVDGLCDIFPATKVVTYTLDPDSQARHSGVIRIGLNEIEIEDIALLSEELRLNPTAVESANLCEDVLEDGWIERLTSKDADIDELVRMTGANAASLGALRNKLRAHILPLKFVETRVSARDSGLEALIAALDGGTHVVMEFGQHRSLLAYMLAANVITRRIHRAWTRKVEDHFHSPNAPLPPQLVITIEEAHKFLNPRAANQTIFGTIARELRKYNVTLLVVDQRPSGIDDEVLSQIGTRIVCALNDDKDIDAALSGVSGAGHLRAILASLDSRQQALILGHAVPMPMALRTRTYDAGLTAKLRQAAHSARAPRTRANPWGGTDPIAGTIRPPRGYNEVFPDDDD